MKRIKILLIIGVAGILALSGCKKKEPPVSVPTTLTMTAFGQNETTASVKAVYNQSFNTLSITAAFYDGGRLSMLVTDPKAGTFDASTSSLVASVYGKYNVNDKFVAYAGTLNITTYANTVLAGNFSFTTKDLEGEVIQVTGGTFETNFTTQ